MDKWKRDTRLSNLANKSSILVSYVFEECHGTTDSVISTDHAEYCPIFKGHLSNRHMHLAVRSINNQIGKRKLDEIVYKQKLLFRQCRVNNDVVNSVRRPSYVGPDM